MQTTADNVKCDVLIVGGGIAGLWLLARLRGAGYHALLVEAQGLGAGQTRHAQGIVHGGTKYTLTGALSASAEAVAGMPALWRACLAGTGEVDLRAAKVLSEHQYLWSTTSLTSRMAGFFASRLMRSRTEPLPASERPAPFQDPAFRGQVYRLDEPVLDTASVVSALAVPHREALLAAAGPEAITLEPAAPAPRLRLTGEAGELLITPRRLVLAAGAGNAALLESLGREAPRMQRRPLHMVLARGPLPTGVYAHCLGASVNPRITISTHTDRDGTPVWYLGGQLAEEGVERTPEAQIAAAQAELRALLPWVDLDTLAWTTLRVDRAEPKMDDGRRPEGAFLHAAEGLYTAWPTKMALAPRLAAAVLEKLAAEGVTPDGGEAPEWPRPEVALLPWQEEERWH